MELKLLGVDEFKTDFTVFYVDRGDDLNLYVWVDEDGSIRLTDIYGLASYCKQAISPIYVGEEMPEDMIDRAYETLQEYPKEKLKKLLDKFNERDKEHREDEEDYAEREEYEDECIKEIEETHGNENGFFWFE